MRPNFGVSFARVSGMQAGSSSWTHTWAIPFPVLEEAPRIPDTACHPQLNADQSTLNWCDEFLSATKELYEGHIRSLTAARNHIDTVKKLIPVQITMPSGPRTKRGLFPFLGQIAKSLFGVATEGDTQHVMQHVQLIESRTEKLQKNFVRLSNSLSSVIETTDERLANALAGVKNNHNIVSKLAKRSQVTDYLMLMMRNTLISSDHYLRVEMLAEKWIEGAQVLLSGFLPLQFIPPKMLRVVLNELVSSISTQYPDWEVTHLDPGFYYTLRDVSFTKSDKFLYISVTIPLSSTASFYDIYSVLAISVPLNSTTSNTTRINNLQPFFAVTRDGSRYTTLSHEVFSTCSGSEVKHCSQLMSLRTSLVPSCECALYFDRPREVLQLCDIRYQEAGLLEGVVHLCENYYLASSTSESWSMICMNAPPKPIRPCKYCIVRLGCQCGISAPNFIMPPKISDCQPDSTEPTYLHAVNLPVLHALYPSPKLQTLTSSTTFTTPLQVHLPDFPIKADNWSLVASTEQKFDMNFKKLAKSVKENTELFKRPEDQLSANAQPASIIALPPHVATPIAIISSVLGVVAFAMSCYLCLVTRRAMALMPLAGQFPLSAAYVHYHTTQPYIRPQLLRDGDT